MIRYCIAGVLALVVAVPASATDFTFDVPVDVRDVPVLTQIRVSCYVSILPVGTTGAASDTNVIGRGQVTVEAPGGTYSGTVSVPVENRGVLRSSDARSYGCDLEGLGRSASGAPITLGGNWSLSLTRMVGTGLISQNLGTQASLP